MDIQVGKMETCRKRCGGGVLPNIVREQAVKLHQQGRSQRDIADTLLIDKKTVGSIVNSYHETGKIQRPVAQTITRKRKKLSLDTMKAIELYKLEKPSIYLKEIRQKLLHDNVCTDENLPSIQTICEGLQEIGYTNKKITSVPSESQTPESQAKFDEYMNYISDIDVHSLHFFDESSVIKTCGKRKYGSSEIGKRAIEIQPYASNATFTINLLHGIRGIDFYSILEGPSNGQELLNFFIDGLDVRHDDGTFKISNGDVIVMDNCGFHHGRNTEPQLRAMLAGRNVSLVFQPPYHPQLNTCEYCFSELKSYLREHEEYTHALPEMAISDGLLAKISPTYSYRVFKHCGYIL